MIISFVLALFIAFYIFISYLYEWWFWRRQSVPGPFRYPFFENALLFLRKPIFSVDYDNARKYGKVYVDYFLPGRSTLNLLDPKLIRQIMVTDFANFTQRETFNWPSYVREGMAFQHGSKWRRLRALVTPVFTTSRMREIYEQLKLPMNQTIRNLHRMSASAADNQVELKQIMKCLTVDMLCSICFSVQIDSYNELDNELVVRLNETFKISKGKLLLLQLLPEVIQKKFNISMMNVPSATYFGQFIMKLIAHRKENPNEKYNDFLQQMIKAEIPVDDLTNNKNANSFDSLFTTNDFENEHKQTKQSDLGQVNNNNENENESDNGKKSNKQTTTRLTDAEIAGQIMLFFFAGVESLTTMFSESLHLLAQNHSDQQQLFDEMQKTFGPEMNVTYDNIFQCEFLNAVMNEVQRMRFSVVRQFRMASKAYDLPVPGFNSKDKIHIPAGQLISVSTYCIHHDPDYFAQPFEFRPERFLTGEVSPEAYMPFGIGPRTCIAYRFAKIMMRFVVANVMQQFDIRLGSKSQVPLNYKLMAFVMDYENMWLKMTPRKLKGA